MSFKSGHTMEQVSGRLAELSALFVGRSVTTHLKPDNWTVMESWNKFGDKYYDFQFSEGDVIISTFPKSGTTWSQEIVWTLKNNLTLDNPAGLEPLAARSPVLEGDFLVEHIKKPKSLVDAIAKHCPDYDQKQGIFLKAVEIAQKPRIVKCHFGLPLLNPNLLKQAKMVYVIRDPRDTCLSYYHHCRVFAYEKFAGTLDQFIDAFIEDCTIWGPFWEHVKCAWEKKDHPNVHITFFELLKRNTKEEYKKLSNFLGVTPTDEQLDKIIHYTSFSEMKKRNEHVLPGADAEDFMDKVIVEKDGGFFRKGTSGGWQKVLTQEQKDKFEKWIKEKCPDPLIMKIIEGSASL